MTFSYSTHSSLDRNSCVGSQGRVSAGDRQIPKGVSEIHTRALQTAARYRAAEIELLDVLDLVDRHRVFLHYGFSSLFQYAVQSLGLSENVAYTFINVTRKAREVPELKREIAAGTLSVSKAKKITSVLTPENKDEWLSLAKTSTQAQVEREVARVHPREASKGLLTFVAPAAEVTERVTVQCSNVPRLSASVAAENAGSFGQKKDQSVRVQLQVGISEKLMLKLRRAQDLVSQRARRPTGLEDTLEAMVDLFLQKHDPVAKAQRQLERGEGASVPVEGKPVVGKPLSVGPMGSESLAGEQVLRPVPSCGAQSARPSRQLHDVGRRKALSAHVKHRVIMRFGGRCSHVDHAGRGCDQTRFLEIHHVKPLSAGGTDELENLVLLCTGHHRGKHLKDER